jgi:hypothetical protein
VSKSDTTYLPVFRYPAIFLLTTFLSLGPNFFERIHLTEVNQALARIAPPKVASKSPIKKLPQRSPVHDPASCPICVALHAPIAWQFASTPSIKPIDQIGSIAINLPSLSNLIHLTAQQCRGPPAA